MPGLAVALNEAGGDEPVGQYSCSFDVARHVVVADVTLRDPPGDGRFGVLIFGNSALVDDADNRAIRLFNLSDSCAKEALSEPAHAPH